MIDNLTMIAYGGMFVLGKMDERKLFGPRMYQLLQAGPNQYKHQLSRFPSDPAFITIPKEIIYYSVNDKELEAVYIQATTGILMAQPAGQGRAN